MAYQLRDVLAAMEADAGIPLKELPADGGAIANGFLAQFQSDMLGVPLLQPRVQEATALGAAYLAGLALGFWESRAQVASCGRLSIASSRTCPYRNASCVIAAGRPRYAPPAHSCRIESPDQSGA